VGNIKVHGHSNFIKGIISNVDCVTRFFKNNIRHLLVYYFNIVKKHVFDMPKFSFILYSNITVVQRWVEFDWALGPKRGVVEVDFRLSKMVSLI
jgi:hypothetical protein